MSKKNQLPEDFDINEFLHGEETLSVNEEQFTASTQSVEKPKVSKKTIPTPDEFDEEALLASIHETEPSQPMKKTSSSKQRKASLQEYRQTFLSVPKITDRKTVFISNELREKIVSIYLRLGTEKSSVSGFIENLVIHHLEEYKEDIENWKKL